MTNIWGFLIQTLSVSLTAGLVFLVKYLLEDKLSPRWQYGVCGVIALRMLFPVDIHKNIYLPITVLLEAWKATVEKGLSSTYTEIYIPATVKHIFPEFHTKPSSISDWIFVVYAIGVVASILWYLISYFRLRVLLGKGKTVPFQMQQTIDLVCKKYHLKSCRTVIIDGLTSAFVCGGFKPVLVLPAGKEIDEKIILHELLHLKYHDELQSLGWCVLRCLHWCNPFLQYVFNRIENDMESLCDQRVLERLEGEERREYGIILLEMANQKYARVPGTSSISNGGKNISRRIAAIVRFKKYPKGMALVSVCIILVLLSPGLMKTGNANAYQFEKREYQPLKDKAFEQAMALARVNRCTTIAGALDTYAKGLLFDNGIYIATASSLSKHEELVEQMQSYDGYDATMYKLESGEEFDTNRVPDGYCVYNLHKIREDFYEAYLVFAIYSWHDSTNNSVIVPVTIRYEDAWVVEERGERILSSQSMGTLMHSGGEITALARYEAIGETGKVVVDIKSYCYVENDDYNSTNVFGMTSMDNSIKPNAEFKESYLWDYARYEYTPHADGKAPESSFGIKYIGVGSLEEEVKFPEVSMSGTIGGGNSDGFNWASKTVDTEDGNRLDASGGMSDPSDVYKQDLPKAYRVQIYWDQELVEELTLEMVESDISERVTYPAVPGEFGQASVYMNETMKKEFKEEKDADYALRKNTGEVQEISEQEMDDMIEKLVITEFLRYEDEQELFEKLASGGIYEFATTYSTFPNIYMPYTKILYPRLFYNANDGTWIVTCGGYCDGNGNGMTKQSLPGNVGDMETFGIRFTETTGSYDTHVAKATAHIANQSGGKRVETENRSDGDGAQGFLFELQDYIYDETLFDGKVNYVGYRWYGACTYASGFENYGGNVTAIYQHTE